MSKKYEGKGTAKNKNKSDAYRNIKKSSKIERNGNNLNGGNQTKRYKEPGLKEAHFRS